MKSFGKTLALSAAVLVSLAAGSISSQAQDRPGGGRDPEQMRQRMMERMREQFDVKDDAEWKLLEGKIQKVTDARRAVGGGFGAFGGGRRPGGDGGQGGGGGNRGGFGGESSPEVEALRKAIEDKAPAEEIKTKLAKVREVRKANEAKLEAAQEDLKKILTVKQEAAAVLAGLVK